MISSHAATMRQREERRLLRLYHGAGDAGAREELVHRFLRSLASSPVATSAAVNQSTISCKWRRWAC
jgi:hypothetical protein